MSRRVLPGLLLLTFGAGAAWPQERRGPEFVVNTFTTGPQTYPAVASAADGSFVVVWQSLGQDGSNEGIFGRRYSAAGIPLGGSDFRVNAYTTNFQRRARVASDKYGAIVVVWESFGQDGSGQGIYARRFDSSGTPGGEFRVNATTASAQTYPSVAADPAGNFVVAWSSAHNGIDYDVLAQRYNAAGVPQGPELRVNTFTTGDQTRPAVAIEAGGNFLIVWDSPQGGADPDVYGQIYDGTGSPQGTEFRVNTTTPYDQRKASAAADAAGHFVVAWESFGQLGGYAYDVMARRYFSNGTPEADEFRVNLYTPGSQTRPAVSADPSGNVVVSWDGDQLHDASFGGVSARRYNVEGTPENFTFPVNRFTTSVQGQPAVAIDAEGHFVVVWSSTTQDGSAAGIVGQRFKKDFIFRDDFETGSLGAWSANQADGGDLAVSTDAALNSTTAGLRGLVDDTAGLYVQDDTPADEDHYRARFFFDTNGFDPGEAQAHLRTRIFIAFEELPIRRLMAIVLRRLGGAYGLMTRVRQDDNSQVNVGFFPISDGPHWVEVDWTRASGPDALDGTLNMWIDGVPVATRGGLDNSLSGVDFVRLGALSVKTGATGTLFWDEFESRRLSFIGP